MASCKSCGKNFMFMFGLAGKCNACVDAEIAANQAAAEAAREAERADTIAHGGLTKADRERAELAQQLTRIVLTTEHSPSGVTVTERLGIVTAECVFGMHMFKDLFAVGRDIFGGRSETIQNTLKDARNTALEELRLEAHKLGANAVIAVDLDYSEISGGGKSMLFLVASGTAVKLG